MDLWKGKIAVVTGASAGIGAAIAVALSREGVNVIGLARRLERVEQLAKENASNPGKITAHNCDVSDLESIKAAFAWIKTKFGRVDILINNAGIFRISNILTDTDEDDLEIVDMINTNLTGLVLCTKEAFKLMKTTEDYGYIININSYFGHKASIGPGMTTNVYSGTKFGVRAISDVLRHELIAQKNEKIRISSISPGNVKTELLTAAGLPAEQLYKAHMHMQIEDIVEMILYVLSRKPHVHIKDIIVQPLGDPN